MYYNLLMLYDLVIIGGGPAGCAAAVYAARKRLKTALIAFEFGGQSTVSDDIQNWIGTAHVSGADLAKNLKSHVLEYKGDILDVFEGEKVTSIEKLGDMHFKVTTDSAKTYETKTVLVTTGSNRRQLPVPGADIFEHKGLTYCASCDGPLFSGQEVIVVGGGNAAFETAAQLLAYCPKVTLINRSDTFRADEITVEKLSKNPNLRILKNIDMLSVDGTKFASGMTIKHKDTNTEEKIPANGIFVEIGQIPNTDFLKNIVELDSLGRIVIDFATQQTKTLGIWAAGDATNVLYHQNNIAAGDAVRALEDLYLAIHTK